jgi:hypothetical protein
MNINFFIKGGILFLFLIASVLAVTVSTLPSSVTVDTGLTVLRNEFNGDTTNFALLNDSELQNISALTIENTKYGKIVFLENINLTENAVGNTIDLDSGINISFNKIEINSEALSSLNKSARIYVYDSGFSSPRILMDGIVCPASICTAIGYVGGTFIFVVTNFDHIYSAEETPVTPGTPTGGTGSQTGGGSTRGTTEASSQPPAEQAQTETTKFGPDFTLDKNPLYIKIKQGQTKRESFRITNTGGERLDINLSKEGLDGFALLDEKNFTLLPKQYKDIPVDFFAREFDKPDIYTGKIVINSKSVSKSLNIIVEVLSITPLFDLRADVEDDQIEEGDKLKAKIMMVNVGDQRKVDVTLDYVIKDFNDEVQFLKEETFAVDRSLVIRREFDLPSSLKAGDYVFYAKLNYNGNIATSAVPFRIIKKSYNYQIIFFISLLIVLILLFLLRKKRVKNTKELSKIVKSEARGVR